MSQITIDELKVFVGMGLKMTYVTGGILCSVGVKRLTGVNSNGRLTRIIFNDDTHASVPNNWNPLVRPWSHLTKEIEVDGERFVPIERIFGCESCRCTYGTHNDRWTTLIVGEDVIGSVDHSVNAIPWKGILALASWHFDIFNWLYRTGEDGEPLAIELP